MKQDKCPEEEECGPAKQGKTLSSEALDLLFQSALSEEEPWSSTLLCRQRLEFERRHALSTWPHWKKSESELLCDSFARRSLRS